MTNKYIMPNQQVRLTAQDKPTRDWVPYLSGIEALSAQQSTVGDLTDLSGGATLADVITRINAIQAALRGE